MEHARLIGLLVLAATLSCGRTTPVRFATTTVSVTVQGSGSVVSAPPGIACPGRCEAAFVTGTQVQLLATTAGGVAVEWSGACTGIFTCDFVAIDAPLATARFGVLLSVATLGDGLGRIVSAPAGIDCGSTCAAVFDPGTMVTLTAIPEPGTLFGGWTGDCAGVAPCAITMDAAHSAGATLLGPGTPLAVSRFGDVLDDAGFAIALDSSAGEFVAGSFLGAIDFGGGAIASAGGSDAFLVSIGPNGTPRWAKAIGGSLADEVRGVAVDTAGNVVVTGGWQGAVNFGGGVLNSSGGSVDAFVVCFKSADGTYRWQQLVQTGAFDAGRSVAVSAGFAVAAGSDGNNVSDAWLRRTRISDGAAQASPGDVTGAGADDAFGIGIAPDGSFVAAGSFSQNVNFNGQNITSNGASDAFLARYSPAAAALLFTRVGGSGADAFRAIAIDTAGNIAAAGTEAGELVVGHFGLDGSVDWLRTYPGLATAQSIAIDAIGDIVVAGSFADGADLGTGPLTAAGGADAFVAKYDRSGIPIWVHTFGGPLDEGVNGIAIDATGTIHAIGFFQGTANFGFAGSATSAGGRDVFVLRLSP